jgi:hypothetical protein
MPKNYAAYMLFGWREVRLFLCKHSATERVENGGIAPPFLTSSVDGGE